MPKKAPRKKTPAKKSAPKLAVMDTAELTGDAANPRKISDAAAKGLQNSLDHFGDLSGIVFNQRTGELVAGHQRMRQIRAKWGDRPVRVLDAARGLGVIEIDESHVFAVRFVDWTKAEQRAANTTANNQRIAGEFTDDVSQYLLEIEAELTAEAPGLLDDVLLLDMLADGLDAADATEEEGSSAELHESYQVIVQCVDEKHQRRVYDDLTKEGLACKVLTL